MTQFDVVVVGGGHAGIEASHAAARIGCKTALVTLEAAALGRMSCNPAIGGVGKSHIVSEVDALGGLMARATDAAGIQFRTLNTTKGPSVRALRAQCDKDAYSQWMIAAYRRIPNITILESEAEEILTEGGRIAGLRLADGETLRCRALILTTGTFLDAVMHFGLESETGGRIGEKAATRLSKSFAELGLQFGRLKTGTPARLDRDSIDFSKCEIQPGEEPAPPFSIRTARLDVEQVPCHLTRTNERTHDIIRQNLDRSPMYTGKIEGVGPRYCPSIEDKVTRFEDRSSHQVFLEPETRGGRSIYPNGISTSLPPDVQEAFLRSIPGLEQCRLLRPGYAVEYTFVHPCQLHPTLEAKDAPGLYLAGQINGTSGYEEAAGQGLVAGINAALSVLEKGAPFLLGRDEAYIGVMIDDLITKDHREPYRMFTSRAEYRLLLRQDNADLRLVDFAKRVGMISIQEHDLFCIYQEAVQQGVRTLETTHFKPSQVDLDRLKRAGASIPDKSVTLAQYLGRPEITLADLCKWGLFEDPDLNLEADVRAEHGENMLTTLFEESEHLYHDALQVRGSERAKRQIELTVQYAGYIQRQREQVERARRSEGTRLPTKLDYNAIRGLRREAAENLARHRPDTLGQAGRIAGVNPSDIAVIQVHLRALQTKPEGSVA